MLKMFQISLSWQSLQMLLIFVKVKLNQINPDTITGFV